MKKRLTLFLAGLFVCVGAAMAQVTASGTIVSDVDDMPIVGATVKVHGGTTGTISDADGKFSLKVPSADTKLEISYVGMLTQVVKAGQNLTIYLSEDKRDLDEVMVVAYGTAKKSAFTGSAAVVKSTDIQKTASTNAVDALKGKVSGVQINSMSGQPGQESFNIRIRGISSINAGKDPLIIVDGSPYGGDISNLSNSDIESMTVLKDAASAALYGARGANGVVIITTKSGKQSASKLTVDAKWGVNSRAIPDYKYVSSPAKYYEMWYGSLKNYGMNALGYSSSQAHTWANNNLAVPSDGTNPYTLGYNVYSYPEGENLVGTNGKLNPNAVLGRVIENNGQQYMLTPDSWTDELYKNSLRQEYTVTASGSSAKGSFYASVNMLDNEGITKASDYKRITGRLKADYQVKKWLKVSGNVSYTHFDSDYLSSDGDGSESGSVFAVRNVAPIYPVYIRDAQGNIMKSDITGKNLYDYGQVSSPIGLARPKFGQANPLCDLELDTENREGNAMTAVGSAEIRFLKDFTFTTTNNVMVDETRFTSLSQPYYGQMATYGGAVSKEHYRTWEYNLQQLLNWHRAFDKHDVEVMLGHEYYRRNTYDLYASRLNIFSITNTELDGAIIDSSMGSSMGEYNVEGWFGRAQYNYDNKYFGSVSFRRDASSRFHPDHRWGNFYSVGGAWLISKEDWFNAPWVDELKIKASYGEQGNDNLGSSYYWTDTYSISNSNGTISLVPSSTKGNKTISWEKNGNFNAGVEFSLFGGRLAGSAEAFYRNTYDMLAWFTLPASYGYTGYYDNIGNVSNKGVEVELDGTILQGKDFAWTANVNFTAYKNTITKLPEERKTLTIDGVDGYSSSNYFYGEGEPLYTWYLPMYAGVDENTGEALYYKDVKDEDGNVTRQTTTSASDADMHLCGSALPWAYGGFGTAFTWKGFDLSLDFQYQLGGKVYDSSYASAMSADKGYQFHTDLLNAWTPENKVTDVPRIQYNDPYTASTSDRWLTSGSYISLQNVNLGYTLPKQLLRKAGFAGVRVYVTANNLWVWSKRQGLDPRQSITGSTSNAYYSPVRTISGGVSLTF